jgi:hypothetical protein
MEISINGKTADITLESEKTLGEVLAGLHQWLEGSGLFLSGLEVDGKIYGTLSMEQAFELSLDGIGAVDIKTSGWAELMLEALVGLKHNLASYEKQSPAEQEKYRLSWETDPAAVFLAKNAPDLYVVILQTLEGSFSPVSLLSLINERIREIENPEEEIRSSKAFIGEIAQRLEDLSLDIQTGKDHRAAETITFFSTLAEKILRVIFLMQHFNTINLENDIKEFNTAMKELIAAYENKDTVLVGDLAEYELAPRLLHLCSVLCKEEEQK